jgi:hypothetical protein
MMTPRQLGIASKPMGPTAGLSATTTDYGACPGSPGCPGNLTPPDIYNLPTSDPSLSLALSPGWSSSSSSGTTSLATFFNQYGLYIALGIGVVMLAELAGRGSR